ncbi:MAG: ABC transporter ATP-binding protein [Gammaproteobacteria bacterium]|nr:ABC transporter ATP-binding protein [Gammaproteobacteria bacterium]
MNDSVLSVKNLFAGFSGDEDYVQVLSDVSFEVKKGRTLGIVGESGCGKSVTALAIMRLLPLPAGRIEKGEILLDGENLLKLPVEKMHSIRGKRIAMIFQEPMTALNPVQKIGRQLMEIYSLHFPKLTQEQMQTNAVAMLRKVRIPSPEKRMNDYPHQLSGGMRQRVMIAMALASEPDILIADEPTTALDVTIQAQVLSLMQDLQAEMGMSIIFVTHDFGVVAQLCDDVTVMYAGRIIEEATVKELFASPKHPYTKGLLSSMPQLDSKSKAELKVIRGVVPGMNQIPSGCRFRDRCDYAIDKCAMAMPGCEQVNSNHKVACVRWQELSA